VRIDVSRRNTRDPLWWGILAAYLLLSASTGYLAFSGRDVNPALNANADLLASKLNDPGTKDFVIELGSLLGFLSASAVSRVSKKEGS
jgi:hypothetical protein